jgi:hypothetical protein
MVVYLPSHQKRKTCRRRVQKLYLGGEYFGCRHCYELSYQSRNEDATSRGIAKARWICARLGGSASYGAPFPHRPKGMWRRTYERLRTEYKRAQMKTVWLWRRRLPPWFLDDADDLPCF